MQNPQEAFGFRLSHLGFNSDGDAEAKAKAEKLSALFGVDCKAFSDKSYFAGDFAEFMKTKLRGRLGHIGFHVDDMKAAIAYFEERGLHFQQDSAVYLENGEIFLIYFEEEFEGFALHLTID